MKVIDKTLQLNLPEVPEKALFLDIETTGLAPVTAHLYLFGCLWQEEGGWHFRQWLLEDPYEERKALKEICGFAAGFDLLIEFNGDHFDLPFLHLHALERGYESPFGPGARTLDLYKVLRPLKKLLGMERAGQKAFEERIGNNRLDEYDGGRLIRIYHDYCKTGDPELQRLLLLHNEEDVIGMSTLMTLLPYARLLDETRPIVTESSAAGPSPADDSASAAESSAAGPSLANDSASAVISLILPGTWPVAVDAVNPAGVRVMLQEGRLSLTLPVYTGELKRFFGPASDYYYLPEEDMAVHKSVAAYVDPGHRVRATVETCYIRKTGTFIPVPEGSLPDIYKKSPDSISYGLISDASGAGPDFYNRLLHHALGSFCSHGK